MSAAPVPKAPPPPAVDPFEVVKTFPTDTPEALKKWEEKIFKGKSSYKVVTEGVEVYLSATSSNASSGLFYRTEFRVEPGVFLSWRWRALEFPDKNRPERLSDRGQDDFAVRIYVVFPGSTFFNTNVIEYIWDESLPEGTVASSPFSGRVKLFVIRSGKAGSEAGGWKTELRDLHEDYRTLFGEEPRRSVGAVAVMSDSDNTRTTTRADFGDFTLKVKKETLG